MVAKFNNKESRTVLTKKALKKAEKALIPAILESSHVQQVFHDLHIDLAVAHDMDIAEVKNYLQADIQVNITAPILENATAKQSLFQEAVYSYGKRKPRNYYDANNGNDEKYTTTDKLAVVDALLPHGLVEWFLKLLK